MAKLQKKVDTSPNRKRTLLEDLTDVKGMQQEDPTNDRDIAGIELSHIYIPDKQVRRYFDPHAEEELVASIREHGVLEPVLVRPLAEQREKELEGEYLYELVFGERRCRAAKKAELETIPATIKELDDAEVLRIQLDENLKREDLNPLERLEGMLDLIAVESGIARVQVESILYKARNERKRKGAVSRDIAAQVDGFANTLKRYDGGTPEGFLSQLQKWRSLPEDIQQPALDGSVDPSKAFEIKSIKDQKKRQELLVWIIEDNPTIAVIRQHVKELKGEARVKHPSRLEKRTQAVFKYVQKHLDALKDDEEFEDLLGRLEALLKEKIGK